MLYQVVKKAPVGDWEQVRYQAYALEKFEDEQTAFDVAKRYLTEVNCNNPLTKDEKMAHIDSFMMTKEGCYLGVLDGHDWYMTDVKTKIVITDTKYYRLEGKSEVAVRQVPGT